MTEFNQYSFSHFFERHYYQGGLSYYQIQAMYEHCTRQKYNDYRFFASLQGVDLEKYKNKQSSQTSLDEQQRKQDLPLFRSEEEYDKMDPEEREKLTQEMMQKHKQWVQTKSVNTVGG
jgi:hypothetical protein